MLQGVDFITKKFVHILVRPISPSRNTFFIHTSSYKNAHFWGAPPYLKIQRYKDIVEGDDTRLDTRITVGYYSYA
jgi:hypothetical protein